MALAPLASPTTADDDAFDLADNVVDLVAERVAHSVVTARGRPHAAGGSFLHPEATSEAFRRILATTDLPPITLRDLRHVAAILTHGGGGDIHTIKETLRHSTITLTSDTYTSLLPEVDRAAAEAAAKLIPRARRHPFR